MRVQNHETFKSFIVARIQSMKFVGQPKLSVILFANFIPAEGSAAAAWFIRNTS
jgi:hypothetical protein